MTHKFFSSLIFFVVLFIAVSSQSFATPKASFLLANAKTGDIVIQEGDVSSRTSPWCSFNIALALIGFETGVLENAEVPEWSFSGDDNSLPFDMWKGKKTPKTWMKYSVVWYSQILAQSVGMEKFKDFLKKFNYGSQDTSGDPDKIKESGLTHCWLGSSLKISPREQLAFVKALTTNQLPVSDKAHRLTREILYRKELSHGWKLYGKPGYGSQHNPDGTRNNDLKTGWFVGWIEKGDQTMVFVSNIQNQEKGAGMTRAREAALQKLTQWIETQQTA